jgi:Flp pilus assembly protein TadB
MRMYVVLVLAALLVFGLSCLTAYVVTARRRARKRQSVAARLDAVVAQAEQTHREQQAAAQVGGALTAVLPAIRPDERAPRSVT